MPIAHVDAKVGSPNVDRTDWWVVAYLLRQVLKVVRDPLECLAKKRVEGFIHHMLLARKG